MNYYMARDGTTYGPYPQESFPSMLAVGQMVPDDLVCPEDGSEWVPLHSVPGLGGTASPVPAMPAAAVPAAAATPSLPRLRMSTPASTPATHPASAPAAAGPTFPHQTFPQQQKAGTMEKLAGAWGLLRIVGYGVAALVVVGFLIAGWFAAQRDKKEIAKLHSELGWAAFDTANTKIDSESENAGYGNNGEAGRVAKKLAADIEAFQRDNFKIEKRPRYRGRSKIGRIVSAADAATAGTGHFETFVEMRDDRVIVLVHVPEFSRYKGEVKEAMLEECWDEANAAVAEVSKVEPPKPPTPVRTAAVRPSGGRAPAASAAPSPQPEPKVKDLTLIVGVRGRSGYEAVYVSKLTANENADAPVPTRRNVPSHQALVKWFGTEKPEQIAAGP